MRSHVSERCRKIVASKVFQVAILVVIVANAVTLGIQTYPISDSLHSALSTADDVFLGIFVLELALRITAYGKHPLAFFEDGWNRFDFVVIAAAFIPGLRENATLLRLVRLLRVVRIVSVLPDLRILVRAMARSLAPIATLSVLTLMLMYVYGMVGWVLFHDGDPANWGNIGQAMLSTFTMLTLENWPSLMQAGIEIHPWSWIFFVSYVLIASFIVINILIAIIINSMEEVREAEMAEERQGVEAAIGEGSGIAVAERLRSLRLGIEELERELGEQGRRKSRRPSKGGRMRG